MKELHELIKYLKDNGYSHLKVNPDLLVGIIEYFASKQETKQCTITDVGISLPDKDECMKELLNRFGYVYDEDGSTGANASEQLKIFSFIEWLYKGN